jgi:dihydroorotate dehydrogenase
MLYSLVKPILFSLDPELAHDISLQTLQQLHRILPTNRIEKPTRVMGLDFPNPVGLAAGLDKNADYLDRAQPGNPKPRVFRLSRHQSLINRMGFNNNGVDHLLERVGDKSRDFVLGINIGKNLSTPVEQALSDYCLVYEKVYSKADYITINISSPNTPGLRDLQNEAALDDLLAGISQLRARLEDQHQFHRPLAVKLSPDLGHDAIPVIADLLRKYAVDGVIATNTTVSRDRVEGHKLSDQKGGLSGVALQHKSRQLLRAFYGELGDDIPIISVGGIDSVEEAKLRFELGAKLIQIYTGLIYRGPGLVKTIAQSL